MRKFISTAMVLATIALSFGQTDSNAPRPIRNAQVEGHWTFQPGAIFDATGGVLLGFPSTGTVTSITGDNGSTTGLSLTVTSPTTTPGLTLGGILNISHGGTGTAIPGLVAGNGIQITGNWPDQVVTAIGGGTSFNPIFPLQFATATNLVDSTEQTIGDTSTDWTAGASILRQTAPLTTTSRQTHLPAANIYSTGAIITFVDGVTTNGQNGRQFSSTGTDTLDGNSSGTFETPFVGGGYSGKTSFVHFETNGLNAWKSLSSGQGVSFITKGSDSSSRVVFDLANMNTATDYTFKMPASAPFSPAVDTPAVNGQFLTGFSAGVTGGASNAGTFTTSPVFQYNIVPTIYTCDNTTIVANVCTVTNNGQIDTVRLNVALTAPLTINWPGGVNYSPGETVRFIDNTGTISATNNVTIQATSPATDTFNLGTSVVVQDPFAIRLAISDGQNNGNWAVSSSSGSGLGVGAFVALTDAAVINQNCDPTASQQNWSLIMTSGVGSTRTLNIIGARNGEQGEIWLTHSSVGGDTLVISGASTPSGGAGLLNLSAAANALDRIRWKTGSGGTLLASVDDNFTAASAPGPCTTVTDTNGTGASGGNQFGGSSTILLRATSFTPGSSYSMCRIDASLFKSGGGSISSHTYTAYVFSDNSGQPGTLLGASSGVSGSLITQTTNSGALANLITFTFGTPVSLTGSTLYWVALGADSATGGTSATWSYQGAVGSHKLYTSGSTAGPWTGGTGGNSLQYFKTYH